MPRTREQNEEIRAKRKEAILKGALQVYVEKGYKAAEIGEVAERAGVARGLVYYYYKDKLSLFRDLFRYMFDNAGRQVRQHFNRDEPMYDLLIDFARTTYTHLFDQSDHVLFFSRMRHDLGQLFERDELRALPLRHDQMQAIAEAMRRGMEEGTVRRMSPDLLSHLFWGAIMTGMLTLRHRNEELLKEGKTLEESRRLLEPDLEDALAVCAAIIRPGPEPGSPNPQPERDRKCSS